MYPFAAWLAPVLPAPLRGFLDFLRADSYDRPMNKETP